MPPKRIQKTVLAMLVVAVLFVVVRAAADAPHITKDIPYAGAGSDKMQSLDFVCPSSGPGPFPLVLWIHGGGWISGDKAEQTAYFLTEHGYAVASINYRLIPQAVFPAQLNDCKAAVRFLREHAREYNIDPNRIGAWGASAGGHLAALLGTTGNTMTPGQNNDTSCAVQAVCDWYGPTDLTSVNSQISPDWGIDLTSANAVHYRLVGSQDKRKLWQASPVAYVNKNDPPFLIMHGARDNIVPISQSRELYKALLSAGCDVKFVEVKDAGHSFSNLSDWKTVLEFFNKKLKTRA